MIATIPVSVTSAPIGENSSNSCLDFISSDASTDRHTESINPTGWKLDNYRRNPVFQNSHQYGDILFTLGKALVTDVRDIAGRPALYQRIEFACDVNPMAKIAFGLYKGGFLSGVSVGFAPLKWQDVPSTRSISPETPKGFGNSAQGCTDIVGATLGGPATHSVNPERVAPSSPSLTKAHDAQPRRIYLEQELLEVSAVAIPANPNALALAYKSGAVEKADLKELSSLLSCTLAANTVPTSADDPNLGFLEQLNAVMRKA